MSELCQKCFRHVLGACLGRAAGVVYWTGPGHTGAVWWCGRTASPFSERYRGMKQRHPPNPILGTARALDGTRMMDDNACTGARGSALAKIQIPPAQPRALHCTRKKLRVSGSASLMSGSVDLRAGGVAPISSFGLGPNPGRSAPQHRLAGVLGKIAIISRAPVQLSTSTPAPLTRSSMSRWNGTPQSKNLQLRES